MELAETPMPSTEIVQAGETAALALAATKIIQSEVAGKTYEDLRPIVQQLGKAGADIVAIARMPIQAARVVVEHWVGLVAAAYGQVPEDRRQLPAPSIAGPIHDNIKHVEPGNPLLKLYENLLARALDRERVNEAHPAFPKLIEQLSADEALLLYAISKAPVRRVLTYDSYTWAEPLTSSARNQKVVEDTFPSASLAFPQHREMYTNRLLSMNLVAFHPKTSQTKSPQTDPKDGEYYPSKREETWFLSPFGELFAKACIPQTWEIADLGSRSDQ